MKKIKDFFKCYLPGFLLGIISACTISVIAATYFPSNDVTYDNTESGLSSTDVQGAIDELYGVCTKEPTAGETIIEDAGLEKDPYECRYFFTGANPNNYITFNDEIAGWRIISVECDGTIKIMRTESIGNQAWDADNSNDWETSDIKSYLNDTYLPTITVNNDKIVSHTWSIGGVTSNNSDLAGQIVDENGTQSQSSSVGMITASEYLRANTNKEQCGNMNMNNTNKDICKTMNWMHSFSISTGAFWTVSQDNRISSAYYVFVNDGYLSSDITLTGDGTEGNPYIITN